MLWGEGGAVEYGIRQTMDGEKGRREMEVRDVMIASSRRDGNALTDRESSRQLRVAGFTVDVKEGCLFTLNNDQETRRNST